MSKLKFNKGECLKYNQHRGIITEISGDSIRITCPGSRKGKYDTFTYSDHPRTKKITENELLEYARKNGCTGFLCDFKAIKKSIKTI